LFIVIFLLKESIMTLSSAEAIVVESISHPAILPADAVISPVVLT
jgi:hypothetical protein